MNISESIVKNSEVLRNIDKENRNCSFLHEYVEDYIETPEELFFLLDKLIVYIDKNSEEILKDKLSEDKLSEDKLYEDVIKILENFNFFDKNSDIYDYLPKLYKLADFLLIPEKILNSIMMECFQYLYLSDKWNQDNFIPEILKVKIQGFWSSFFKKYSLICRKIHEHTTEIKRDEFFVKRDIYYDFGDVENIFGEIHRTIAKKINSMCITENLYYQQHTNICWHFDKFLEILDEVIIREKRKCHSYIRLEHFELFNLKNLEDCFNEADDNKFKSVLLGHNQNTCQCDVCIKTHINCDCKIHKYDCNHYIVDSLEEPEPDDYYDYSHRM